MIYYIYTDEEGRPLFRVGRDEAKNFWVEKYIGPGRWAKGIEGIRLVPYRLDEVIREQDIIFIVEGEKDVETIRSLGFTATTNPFGAGKWKKEFNSYFKWKRVILLPDNDEVGRRHMEEVAANIYAFAKEVKLIPLPGLKEKEDVTDWFNYGHSEEELMDLVDESQYIWVPKRREEKEQGIGVMGSEKVKNNEEGLGKEKFPAFPREIWRGLLADYLELVGPCTEAPDAFHFASIIINLGLCLGRKFYFYHPHPVYQNYYFMVVGASALTHKSTALTFANEVAKWLEEDIKIIHIFVSAEGIYNMLAESPGTRLLVSIDELRTLFANAQRPGTANIFSNLSALYDPKEKIVVGQKKNFTIENALISMISAVTPELISETMEIEAAIGGFLNRHVIVAGEPKGPISNPLPPDEKKRIDFIKEVRRWKSDLPKDGGIIIKGSRAMKVYDEYYRNWRKEIEKEKDIIQTLRRREAIHVIKLGAMFALLNGRMEIFPEDIERGIKVIDHSRICQGMIFKDIELSRMALLEKKIKESLRDGPKSIHKICNSISSKYNYGEKVKAIENLQKAGIIEEDSVPNKRGKVTRICYLIKED